MAVFSGRAVVRGGGVRARFRFAVRVAMVSACLFSVVAVWLAAPGPAVAQPAAWLNEWPRTDFTRHSIDLDEIRGGGPPKDGIPAIDDPKFVPVGQADIGPGTVPVVSVKIGGEARAYPLAVLIWHEIVNDTVGGVPVAVTFCPLCNAAVVFERRVDGRVLDFGTTGKLRKSNLLMYDRQSESWWQQFLGEAVVGAMTGKRLRMLPARIESIARFRAREPAGMVLVPRDPSLRRYGVNPYYGYDSAARPFLYDGEVPENIRPLERVVSLGERGAWALSLVRARKEIRLEDGTVIRWEKGQNSALDDAVIARGADVGNVTVRRDDGTGEKDVLHGIDFAFAYHAFYPDAPIHVLPAGEGH